MPAGYCFACRSDVRDSVRHYAGSTHRENAARWERRAEKRATLERETRGRRDEAGTEPIPVPDDEL